MYKQPEYTQWFCQHNSWCSLEKRPQICEELKSLQKSSTCLSSAAICYPGSRGCYSFRRIVCCRLCCRGDGCRSSRSGGGSRPCGRTAGDALNPTRLHSAGFGHRCPSGTDDADSGYCRVALSRLHLNVHRTAAVGAWRNRRLTAQAAACGAATWRCSG